MKNNTQGFTLIELLIVIAIIGILAAVLIPNLLGAQKRAYDTGAQSCAKSIQTAEAIAQIDGQAYIAATTTMSGANASCNNGFTTVTGTPTASDYSIVVLDNRGSKKYTITPSSLTGAPQ